MMRTKHCYTLKFDPAGDSALTMLSRLISRGATVLELGPATGYFTKYLTEDLGCTVDCVEISAEMAAQASRFARDVWVTDVDEVRLADRFPSGAYDYVIAADVLEHLRDPWRLVQQVRDVLAPTGKLLVSIPNVTHSALLAELVSGSFDYRDEGLLDRTHLRFFTRRTAIELLRHGGFRIDEFEQVERLPEHTEFKSMLERLPRAVADFLAQAPEARTYQFVAAATPGIMSDAEVESLVAASVRTEPQFRLVVLWADVDELFTEERSKSAFASLGAERQLVRFEISRPGQIRRIRIDPSDRPGFFHVFALRVYRKSRASDDHELVWEAKSADEIVRQTHLNNVLHLPSTLGGAFLSTTTDPWFTITLPESVAQASSTFVVEIELDWPMSADFILVRDTLVSRVDALEVALRNSGDLVGKLEGTIAAERRQLEQVRSDFERVDEEAVTRQSEIMALGMQLQRSEIIRRLRKVETDKLRQAIASSESASAALRMQLQRSEIIRRLRKVETDKLRQIIASSESANAALREELGDREEKAGHLESVLREKGEILARREREMEGLRQQRDQSAGELEAMRSRLAASECDAKRLSETLMQEQAALADLARLAESSLAFRTLVAFRRTRDRFVPVGTTRRRLYDSTVRAASRLRGTRLRVLTDALESRLRLWSMRSNWR
ncbi:MAG: methyltransferase domain-containing protein [Deltaproteobacteria bacterium]|nr:methyltransferase domain-containing protein [Deltaproteobacteria bacterium]